MLKDPNVPESVKTTVQSMNNDGMQLLNDYYDKNSNFINMLNQRLLQMNSMQTQIN